VPDDELSRARGLLDESGSRSTLQNKPVGDLKKEIKKEKGNALAGIDPDSLVLWKVRYPVVLRERSHTNS
jgi:hypothetical protein